MPSTNIQLETFKFLNLQKKRNKSEGASLKQFTDTQ